jgi:hypothetical protein
MTVIEFEFPTEFVYEIAEAEAEKPEEELVEVNIDSILTPEPQQPSVQAPEAVQAVPRKKVVKYYNYLGTVARA